MFLPPGQFIPLIPIVRRAIVLLSIAVLFACSVASHAEPEYINRQWSARYGLPDDRVTAVVQSRNGYLWVSTFRGVARFDGARFVSMMPERPRSRGFVPRALCATHDGAVWAALDHGTILCWKEASAGDVVILDQKNGLPDAAPTSICEDGHGHLFVAFFNAGVFQITGGGAVEIPETHAAIERNHCFVIADAKGDIWCAANDHVGQIRDGKIQNPTEVRDFRVLAPARHDGIWIGSHRRLGFISSSHSYQLKATLPLAAGGISCIQEDENGQLWLGTGAGLFRVTDGGPVLGCMDGISLKGLANDREGILWVATANNGLHSVRTKFVRSVLFEPKRVRGAIQSMTRDASGDLWLLSEGREIVRIHGGVPEQIALEPGDYKEKIMSIAAALDGSVFIGARNRGLFRWCNGVVTSITPGPAAKLHPLNCLFVDSNGALWIGLDRGIAMLCGEEFRAWRLPEGTSAHAICEAPGHQILVAVTGDNFLYRLAENGLEKVPMGSVSNTAFLQTLAATSDGAIWLGFDGWGLARLKDGQLQRATQSDGLLDDCISQMLVDAAGRLWIGSNRGVSRIDPADFDAFASHKTQRLRVVGFGREEEELGIQTNRGIQPNCFRTPNGELWFSAGNKAVIVDPTARRENRLRPPVMIDSVRVDGRESPLQAGRPLLLPASHGKLEFNFAALSFSSPENVEFRYQLEGVDNGWVDAGTDRRAIYSRLAARDYRFRVLACNDDGYWNETGATFAFTVTPFLWQSWWFQIAMFSVACAFLVWIVRYVSFRRLQLKLQEARQQAALDKERARIARDLHDDLGCSLTHVALLLEMNEHGATSPAEPRADKPLFSSMVRQVVKSVDEIIWAINPRNDKLPFVIDYIVEFAAAFLQAANIHPHVTLPDQIPDVTISPEVRHNLFLVVKEVLNNVVRHAAATEVRFDISTAKNELRLRIEDNGQGFEGLEQKMTADGLPNMRERMEEIGGEFSIQSKTGQGTCVTLTNRLPS